MFRLGAVLSLALLVSASLMGQERLQISPELAASHLMKKIEPVYPAWAKAEGVQGVVRFRIEIDTNGRVLSWQVQEGSGPSVLNEAAANAVRQYVYLPFETGGHPVGVSTLVDVAFTLRGTNIPRPRPAPKFSSHDFTWFQFGYPSTEVSPVMREWLASSDLREGLGQPPCGPSDALKVFEIPVARPHYHLYLVAPPDCAWTAPNNGIEAVEEDETGVGNVFDAEGSGFYVSPRKDSPYPDIFIVNSMGAVHLEVRGFSQAAGAWRQLYCGGFDFDSDGEHEDIGVCL